jgi:hypothetical protein
MESSRSATAIGNYERDMVPRNFVKTQLRQLARLYRSFALPVMLAGLAQSEACGVPRHVGPTTLDRNTSALFKESMDLDTQLWDPNVKLVHRPRYQVEAPGEGNYMVRVSSWYALGLLYRDAAGDRQRAAEILAAVLEEQYVTPGVRWYGTYKTTPEEPDPKANAVMWTDYDPNWRHFIGTTFAMILIEYPDRISPELSQRMYTAIDRAIEGEIAENRLVPSYSNVALMYGFLWDFAGAHDKRDDWHNQATHWIESVYGLFKTYGVFDEYNSPTYCGVDLYGLALWRSYGSSPRIRSMGAEMEAGLWRDIASLYQPALRNISGPYDRAYGMDMESYVSVVGVWMRTVLDAEHAPLPTIGSETDHVADVWYAPHIAILGTRIPPDALEKMRTFAREHLVRTQITEQRIATAWIGRDVIFGGEATSKRRDAGPNTQFHPATIQWRTPSGKIGWIRVVQSPMIDATADERGLTISATGTIRLRVHAKDVAPGDITAAEWRLPGLHVAVMSDTKSFRVQETTDAIDVVYTGMTRTRLDIEPVVQRHR